ncbi:MAG: glucose-6-phosphate isomerase [Clostridia bacterium]|nr:glucose-6-phosphate isomerase [Clostridia bacterium]
MRVKVDFSNMMAENIGERGIRDIDFSEAFENCSYAVTQTDAARNAMRWRDLHSVQSDVLPEVKRIAERVRRSYDTFVVLGIGGSALGPIAVQQALNHLHYNSLPAETRNGPKFYVEDNIDPQRMSDLLDIIDLRSTAFNVISKSGSTSETMAQLLIIIAALKDAVGDEWASHLIITTDRERGNLIGVAKAHGMDTLYVPDGVGGRFSELCPVGLLPAAVCGIDIEALLDGARYMDELCTGKTAGNPAYTLAVLSLLAIKKGCNISVIMPYSDSLKYFADWYAQLWAESLGKATDRCGNIVHCGQTPVKALGVTDQHSQVQLYTGGPFDKVITFIGVDNHRANVCIPRELTEIPDIAFLCGSTLNALLDSELYATQYAVSKSGHMNLLVCMPEVNAFTVGQLIMLFELQTAYMGELLNIDAFDQPGVEEGKNATYALLGKRGFDDKREELERASASTIRYRV